MCKPRAFGGNDDIENKPMIGYAAEAIRPGEPVEIDLSTGRVRVRRIGTFIDAFIDFIADPEGLSEAEIEAELAKAGVDVPALMKRVEEIREKYLGQGKSKE